ncbi:MAG: ATP-dependent zinc metalloprotease FtsH [Calditrichaeota bacterium]|nr:MAG: ATP-dependent zinc metalloprotease FtsH [Calditrichota bacterium]
MAENKTPNPSNNKAPKNFVPLLVWSIILISLIFFISTYEQYDKAAQEVEIPFPRYRELLEDKMIKKAIIIENEFHGELTQNVSFPIGKDGNTKNSKHIRVIFPSVTYITTDVITEWDKLELSYIFKEKTSSLEDILWTWFPTILLLVIFLYFMRRMQGGGAPKGIFNFGKSKAKIVKDSKVTFDDVSGVEEAKAELVEIIDFLKSPQRFHRLGAKVPKGVLLLGPPGTGKTLLARAVAGEAGVPFFSMSGADFVEMFVGVGASRVRDLFENAKKNSPCIIFIDEIDAVGRQRGAGLGGGHDEREQTLNQLLVEMDGFEESTNIILIASTNRPDVLDKALLRPGRFDRQVVVDLPDKKGREGILNVHSKKVPLGDDVKIEKIAQGTPGLSGADLANIVNESAIFAARKNAQVVTMNDFEDAKDKIMLGVERKSAKLSERDKEITAYHEAGHVITGKLMPESDPVHKVTIIPRGRALGLTHFLPADDVKSYSRTYCESRLVTLMGGRVAEKIIFNHLTTGAGNDLDVATKLVRKMVCDWGFSDKVGPMTCGKQEEEIFLGREIAQHRDYSEKTAQIIDDEIKKILLTAEKKATELLKNNLDKLHALSKALIQQETLDSDEIDEILNLKTNPSNYRKRTSTPRPKRTNSSTQNSNSANENPKQRTERTTRTRRPSAQNKAKQNSDSQNEPKNDSKTEELKVAARKEPRRRPTNKKTEQSRSETIPAKKIFKDKNLGGTPRTNNEQ